MTDERPATAGGSSGKGSGTAGRLPTVALRSIALRLGVFGLNAVTGVLTARLLQPEGRGEVAAMIIWPMLLAGLTSFGLPSALVYHVRRDPKNAPAIVGWALLLCTLMTVAGTAIAWHILPVWLHQHTPDVIFAAQLCLLTTIVCAVTLLGRAAWEARSQFGRSNLSQLLTPITVIASLTALVGLGRLTPMSAAAAYMLGGVPGCVWALCSIAVTYRPTLRSEAGLWRQLLFYGARAYGVSISGVLTLYLDQAMVVGFLSSTSMGIYAVAVNLARVVGAANTSVAMIVFPRVVGLARGDMAKAVARSARLGTIAGGGIGLVVLVTGPALIRSLYGSAFSPAAEILPILVCYVIVAGLVGMLLQGFMAAGRPGVATAIHLIGLVCSVPLYVVFVPWFGLVGAASVLLTSAAMRLILTMVAYRAILRVPAPRVWLDSADIAELGRYRSALVDSVLRFGTAGGVK